MTDTNGVCPIYETMFIKNNKNHILTLNLYCSYNILFFFLKEFREQGPLLNHLCSKSFENKL